MSTLKLVMVMRVLAPRVEGVGGVEDAQSESRLQAASHVPAEVLLGGANLWVVSVEAPHLVPQPRVLEAVRGQHSLHEMQFWRMRADLVRAPMGNFEVFNPAAHFRVKCSERQTVMEDETKTAKGRMKKGAKIQIF